MDSEILTIYTNLPEKIRGIKSWTVRKDLLKMYRNCENIKREIAREQVNSRNVTVNHQLLHLNNKFSESVTNLDQYVTLALLSI